MTNMVRPPFSGNSSSNSTRLGNEDVFRGIDGDRVWDVMLELWDEIWDEKDELYILDSAGRKAFEAAGEIFQKINRSEPLGIKDPKRVVVDSAIVLYSNRTTPLGIKAALRAPLQRN